MAEAAVSKAATAEVHTPTEPIEAEARDVSTIGHPAEQLDVEGERINATEDESKYPTGIKFVATISALVLILLSGGFDISVVAVTVPSLSNKFKILADIGWYSTALRLTQCSFMFVAGKVSTLFDLKKVLMVGVGLFTLGNLICTAAVTSKMFISGRAVAGFGFAFVLNSVLTIFTLIVPVRKRAFYSGLGGGVETLASISAPLIGGALIDGWTWRACYGVNVPMGIITMIVAWFTMDVPQNPDHSLPLPEKLKRMDLLGAAIFIPAMVCLMLGLQWGGLQYSWQNARVVVLLVMAVLLFGLFGFVQLKSGERASLPIRIMKKRSLLAGTLFSCCANSVVAVVEYYMSIYFQGVRGFSAAKSGVYALPMLAGMAVAVTMAGLVTTRTGHYFPSLYVSTILCSVATGVLSTIKLNSHLGEVLAMQALIGCGMGAGIQGPYFAAQLILDAKEVPLGMAMLQFGQQIGPVLFLAASTALFTSRLHMEIGPALSGTNATSIDNLGLSDLRDQFGGPRLEAVLMGYDSAVAHTLYLPLALAILSGVGAVAIERKSMKTKKN